MMMPHPSRIWALQPGAFTLEGVAVRIGADGLREPAADGPADGGLILTVGDSSIFGFGVADDQVFSSVAAKALGEGVEPVVGATPGYSTFETLNLLHMRALSTEPDLLVICNLWSDNNFDHFRDADLLHTRREFLNNPLAQSALYQLLAGALDGLRGGQEATETDLRNHVAHEIGAIAKPKTIYFTPDLPKTRSGKIMRRLLRDVAEGRPVGDVTTLADSSVMSAINDKLHSGATD
jgi:hypothetical protein